MEYLSKNMLGETNTYCSEIAPGEGGKAFFAGLKKRGIDLELPKRLQRRIDKRKNGLTTIEYLLKHPLFKKRFGRYIKSSAVQI